MSAGSAKSRESSFRQRKVRWAWALDQERQHASVEAAAVRSEEAYALMYYVEPIPEELYTVAGSHAAGAFSINSYVWRGHLRP